MKRNLGGMPVGSITSFNCKTCLNVYISYIGDWILSYIGDPNRMSTLEVNRPPEISYIGDRLRAPKNQIGYLFKHFLS